MVNAHTHAKGSEVSRFRLWTLHQLLNFVFKNLPTLPDGRTRHSCVPWLHFPRGFSSSPSSSLHLSFHFKLFRFRYAFLFPQTFWTSLTCSFPVNWVRVFYVSRVAGITKFTRCLDFALSYKYACAGGECSSKKYGKRHSTTYISLIIIVCAVLFPCFVIYSTYFCYPLATYRSSSSISLAKLELL